MKIAGGILGGLAAIALGFLFAGLAGAFLFGACIVLTHSWLVGKKPTPFKLMLRFLLLTAIGYGLMHFFGLLGAGEMVKRKVELIQQELRNNKQNPRWVIISQKRNKYYNKILANSVDNSQHLRGMAMDVYVIDVNGDGSYTKEDVEIIKSANKKVESEYPALKGTLGIYLKKENSYLTRHMVHFQVGYASR